MSKANKIEKAGSDYSFRWHAIVVISIAAVIALLYFVLQPIIQAR